MKTKEFIGKITFEEKVNSLQANILPKTLVIDIPNPYKAYYGEFSPVKKPNSIVFVLKKPCSFEKALIVTDKINKKHSLSLSVGKCEIKVKGKSYYGIRLKNIEEYTQIKNIQQYYKDENFVFAKQEDWKEVEALIKVNRFFNIEKMADAIYMSKDDPEKVYYIDIPKHLRWELFKTTTLEINHNITDKSYDVTKVVFYKNGGIDMMIRVAKPKASLELLQTIKNKYLEKTEHL